MNAPPPTDDPLLRALLHEAAPADFRDATLAATLRGARRRRIRRHLRAGATLLAIPLLAAALLLAPRRAAPALARDPVPAEPPGHATVRTRAAPEILVRTTPLSAGQLIASSPLEFSARIRTDTRLGPILINDVELLALAPSASALVRLGPGRQQLVFPDTTSEPRVH